jgi:hypothetical protein
LQRQAARILWLCSSAAAGDLVLACQITLEGAGRRIRRVFTVPYVERKRKRSRV